MPHYDFKCSDCGEKLSVFVSISEKSKLKCPKCGSSELNQEYKSVYIGKGAGTSGFKRSSCSSFT